MLLFVADLKRFGRVFVLSSLLAASLFVCAALNVLEEREMRNLGKATRTLFVTTSLVVELFESMVVFAFADWLVVVAVVLVFGEVEMGNLRLFALV